MKLINHNGDEIIPLNFHLSQNYPNPFKDKTKIKYCIAYKTIVNISVLNSQGDPIEILVNDEQDAGTYEIEFIGRNLPKGEYFIKITAGNYSNIKKMHISE